MRLNQQTDFTDLTNMKVAIISDTHEQLSDQVKVLADTCDLVIHAGDIGSSAVLESLQPKTGHVIAVAGNNDKPYLWDFKDWDLVKNLPVIQQLQLPGGRVAIEHGHKHDMYLPEHNDLRNAHPDVRLVIYGHTHIQLIDQQNPGLHVLNPGAAGFTRNKGGPSCIILSIDGDNWQYQMFKFADEEAS